MLVIGHRGACGLAPENTLASMHAAVAAGVLILEFDVQTTKDGIPVVIHDASLLRTHKKRRRISSLTAKELRILTTDCQPVPTLAQVLDAYWGRIYLNIEIKGKGTAAAVVRLLQEYCDTNECWDNCFISSFSVRELKTVRALAPHANLALLHNRNPFAFLAYYRQLELSAVGWHRLYTSQLATEIAKRMGLFTYVYTVNRPSAAQLFAQQGFDAVVTDRPDIIHAATED